MKSVKWLIFFSTGVILGGCGTPKTHAQPLVPEGVAVVLVEGKTLQKFRLGREGWQRLCPDRRLVSGTEGLALIPILPKIRILGLRPGREVRAETEVDIFFHLEGGWSGKYAVRAEIPGGEGTVLSPNPLIFDSGGQGGFRMTRNRAGKVEFRLYLEPYIDTPRARR